MTPKEKRKRDKMRTEGKSSSSFFEKNLTVVSTAPPCPRRHACAAMLAQPPSE
ncbi:MAG: hypothetical protein LBT53_06040 [Puniceicoccales bacterium]|nr:hypothetical protein [Puniceicoccales bacterium]